ncbi:hypothetical protein LSH36_574g01081 [Paralvinella palmiformis]|uniref:Uncharacterized protein n=1 Tax=Paralvinella palmiformis TaxID=53620 RepID=A0AAD9MWS7_9ANNE|nr:hypothetical protein LSH36_574g01081 [Paralvinella palmiformis]
MIRRNNSAINKTQKVSSNIEMECLWEHKMVIVCVSVSGYYLDVCLGLFFGCMHPVIIGMSVSGYCLDVYLVLLFGYLSGVIASMSMVL